MSLAPVFTPGTDIGRSTSLVQTRAFSFSDDSAHVSLPFHNSSTSPKHSSPQTQVFLHSFEAALAYFKIRKIQSEWYTDLFQSSREIWHDPYPYIWKTYAKMTDWYQSMPASTLPSMKAFFELELLYSYVYILSPSPRIPHIDEYAQRLIFEHCIAYATNLISLLSKSANITRPAVTFYDAMRAYMTGRQFVDVLSRNFDVILNPVPPTPPIASQPQLTSEDPLSPPMQIAAPAFPPPTVPEGLPAPKDPTNRAIDAINDFTAILSRFGLRFGFTHWRDRFQRESGALMTQLYQRASTPTHSPPVQSSSPHPTFHSQSWIPSTSPQMMYHQQHPTTPPNMYPNQPSPFASSPYNAAQQTPSWTTPSPQPMQEMPLPTEGRVRQAMVYGQGPLPLQ
jgi:hypothetical protein